jgi:ribosome maturation factor RimP
VSSRQNVLVELIQPVVEAMGCELWGLEYIAQGKHSCLRIYIEKESGVGVEDCEKISRQVSSVMDVEDPITGHYTLEVSSPGMDRPLYNLEQYKRFLGENVFVKLTRAFEQRKTFKGMLVAVENDDVVIRVDDEEYLLPFEQIEKANIIPMFN